MPAFRQHYLVFTIILTLLLGCIPAVADGVSAENSNPSRTSENIVACCTPEFNSPMVVKLSPQYLFGVLNDDGEHFGDEWARGVRATNLELHWDKYEMAEGMYDQDYIHSLQQRMAYLKSQGWYVQLVPGFHYVPEWVYANYPDFYFVNQYGDIYNPDPATENDMQAINAPFNPQARALIGRYLEHLLSVSFPQDDPLYAFDSIRVGGGPQGELRYPPGEWNGKSNSYWAFSTAAQDSVTSGIPDAVIGWRPGIDPNPGSAEHGQLIVNPGFEDSHAYYTVYGWSPDDEVTASFDQASAHSGNYALKIRIQSPHRVHQFIKVDSNIEYVVSGWLRTDGNGGLARLFLTQYDANFDLLSGSPFVKRETASTSWEYVEANLTTTQATRFIKVELDGDRVGSYYFDDLQLTKVGESDMRSREIEVPTLFYDWYVEKLADYQNWQIMEIRKYFNGQLDVLYAGKGIQPKQIMGALTNDLMGDGWSEGLSSLYAGTDFQRHVTSLMSSEGISLYVTGIDVEAPEQVDDLSIHPSDWSAARWISYLAHSNGMPVWGENSGGDTEEKLWLSAKRMHENNFTGLMWGFEAELYANPNPNNYAGIADYEQVISFYNNFRLMFIPIVRHK